MTTASSFTLQHIHKVCLSFIRVSMYIKVGYTGRRVHLVLLGVVCDHPAMCKLSGFADHSHNTAPCSKCTVSQEDLFSDQSLRNGMYCNYLYDTLIIFSKNFLLVVVKIIVNDVTRIMRCPTTKNMQRFSRNMALDGPNLPASLTLISSDIP